MAGLRTSKTGPEEPPGDEASDERAERRHEPSLREQQPRHRAVRPADGSPRVEARAAAVSA